MQNHLDEVDSASHVHYHRPCNDIHISILDDSEVMDVHAVLCHGELLQPWSPGHASALPAQL